jgi:hypothetical protein
VARAGESSTPAVPRDHNVRPSLDEVLQLRRDRMSTVRQVIEGLTDESLDGPHRTGRGARLAGVPQLPGA